MPARQSEKVVHYSSVAKFLHWAIMLLVIVQFITASIMPGVRHNQTPGFLLSIHMSFGLTIIALMIVRLLWRFTHASPPEDTMLPRWQHTLAHLMHYALYALLILVPLFGWAWASSRGWPVTVFGIYTLPSILAQGSAWGRVVDYAHAGGAVLLLMLIGFHILAALYHHYILEDTVLNSMVPKNLSL
jgi:cytochrome b561